ncbi:MAG: hypothetical protein H0V70_01835 [Ktedonobacteraceae bacterium]|nr:hypothetical protein [Ktedonobacteraceae bacterium]
MLTALSNGELVNAKDVCKDDGPFLCLECNTHLHLKKGTIKAHHFAHLIDAGCHQGYGEGEMHRQLKDEICATFSSSPRISNLQQERRDLKRVYPDIIFLFNFYGKWWIAIEVHASSQRGTGKSQSNQRAYLAE